MQHVFVSRDTEIKYGAVFTTRAHALDDVDNSSRVISFVDDAEKRTGERSRATGWRKIVQKQRNRWKTGGILVKRGENLILTNVQ